MGAFCSQPAITKAPEATNHFWSSQALFQAHFDSLKLPESITLQFSPVVKASSLPKQTVHVFLDPNHLKKLNETFRIKDVPVAYLVCGVRGLVILGKRRITRLDVLALVQDQTLQCLICCDDNDTSRYWSCPSCSKTICFVCVDKMVSYDLFRSCAFCRQSSVS